MRALVLPIPITAVASLTVLVAGCAALNRPYPAKRCFALETPQRPEHVSAPASATIQVRQFRVSPPYNQPQFVYKLGEAEFKRDYYDEFIASPAELLTSQAIAWLCDSGTFRTTCAGSSAADHDLVLEAVVTSLYGNYTKRSAPEAVLAIHFFVLGEEGTRTNVVLDRSYAEHVELNGDDPDVLVRGWSQARQRILASLEADLRVAPGVNVAAAHQERNP